MASRRRGYESLPDTAVVEGEQEEHAGGIAGATAAGSSRVVATDEAEGSSSVVGEGGGEDSGGKANGGSKGSASGSKEDLTLAKIDGKDPTEGLPTAQGVFVGTPISYNTGGSMGYNATPMHATAVITSAPPSYDYIGDDGRGIAVPQSGSGATVQHTVITMNAPAGHQFGAWGRQPQPFVCRACGFTGLSLTVTDPCSSMPLLTAACCCLVGCWPCSFIPFLIPELRDTVHRCPNCHIAVGRSRQFQ